MNITDDNNAIIIGSGGGIGKALKQQLFKENSYKKIRYSAHGFKK